MPAEAVVSVSALVVLLTQLAKWSGVPDKWGPVAVLVLSFLGVAFWGWSDGSFERVKAFQYLSGFGAVATSAAGVYGFTRASRSALVKTEPPPGGAGQSTTIQ